MPSSGGCTGCSSTSRALVRAVSCLFRGTSRSVRLISGGQHWRMHGRCTDIHAAVSPALHTASRMACCFRQRRTAAQEEHQDSRVQRARIVQHVRSMRAACRAQRAVHSMQSAACSAQHAERSMQSAACRAQRAEGTMRVACTVLRPEAATRLLQHNNSDTHRPACISSMHQQHASAACREQLLQSRRPSVHSPPLICCFQTAAEPGVLPTERIQHYAAGVL
jgi:hypothetical protein